MKKITFLFALLCASVMGWAADQNTDLPIAAGCDAYAGKVQWKAIDGVATPSNVVEIQKSGNIPSVYVTFADAGFNQVEGCEWDNHVSGACIWVHLPLTYEYTNIYIKQNGTVRWGFTIYYKDGTPNGTPCTDETAPSVSAVSVGSITYNSAVLTVTALDNDGGSGISKYIVKNGDDQIASSTSNEITLTKLTPNTTYNTLKVYAQDGCNNESSAFDVESFKTENLIYNQFPTGHLSNPTFGDIYGRILLTIKKVNNTTIAVKVDPNNNGTRGIKYMNIIVNGVNHEYGNNDGSGDDLTGYFEIGGLASLNFTFNLFFYCNTPNWTTNQFSVTESQLYVEAPSDTEKPSMADATVTKVSQTHNSVVISITDAEDNVGVTKYVVKNHSNNSSVGEYTPSEGKITVSDLSPSTGYNWDIYAKDAAGNVSDNYKNISFTTDALVSNYCGETLTSTDNNATVDMSCEFKNNKYIITFTNPTLSGEASVLSGFNGSFCTIGGTGAHDARDHYGVNNSEKIVLEFDGVPNFYTDLYINIPGGNQRIFSWPNDVVWGTCPDVAVTGVSLNHDELNMVVGGGTQTLVATIAPTNATNQNVTWVSDDTDVATVENGVVTAVGAGTAHITVTTQDGSYSDQCTVNVTVPAITPVTYNGYGTNKGVYALYSITRDYDQSLVFSAKVDAAFGFNKRVHYYKNGVADVWVDLVYNSVTGTYDYTAAAGPFVDGDEWVVEFYFPFTGDAASIVCNYTVGSEQTVPANIPVGAVVLNKAAATLSVGETDNLTATVYPSFATAIGSITWESDAPSYASVDAGTVTAVAPGAAHITATCGSVTSDPYEVTVSASLEEAKYYGCGAFVNKAGKVVAYDYVFTRATNHEVTLDVVFSRSMNGIIGSNNFQMYVNGVNKQLTYNDANRTATYAFGAQTESASINYYFYFVLDGGGVHQTQQVAYVVGAANEAVHAFAIGENDDTNVAAIAAADGQTFDQVFVARSFTAGSLYTLVLPFCVDAMQTAAKLPGQLTKLNNTYVKDNDDLRINFVDVDAIEAGVPYLYTPSADVANPVFAAVTIEQDLNPTTADTHAKYYGIYAPTNGVALKTIADAYVLGSDLYLYDVQDLPDAQTMKALRGYFVLNFPGGSNNAPKRIAKVVFNATETEATTAIEDLQAEPTQCTKIMVNGLMYIVREGKMYNLQGQLVK